MNEPLDLSPTNIANALHLKYRPRSFKDVIGNRETVQGMQAMIEMPDDNRPRSYLFTGPAGCGKTTLARIYAAALGCTAEDFNEKDTGLYSGKAEVLKLREEMMYRPKTGPISVYLFDECHKFSKPAQEALLKSLEDTPRHVYLLMATTEPQMLEKTFKSRLINWQVAAMGDQYISRLLGVVIRGEGLDVPAEVVSMICKRAGGSAREALTRLQKVMLLPKDRMLKAAEEDLAEEARAIDLARLLLENAPWEEVAGVLTNLKDDPEGTRLMLLSYFEKILLSQKPNSKRAMQAASIMAVLKDNFYNTGRRGLTLALFTLFV